MKRFFTLAIALMIAFAANAQNDVTRFLGIPVDGTKSEMKQKLIKKALNTILTTTALQENLMEIMSTYTS